MDQTYRNLAYALLLLAGLALWLINWWAGRPLFIDEANLVRNLYDRSFGELFTPLDHAQYAPPLYLVLAKACGELFGYGERSLRLPALLGGVLGIVGLVLGSRTLRLGDWTLLVLALLFVNPTVLRYVGEVKPYALDLGIAALLLAGGLRYPRPHWLWVVAGAVAVWWSLPAAFVLAAVGGTRLFAKEGRLGWLLVSGLWLLSFVVLYLVLLRPSVNDVQLANYHEQYFFPLPGTAGFDWLRALWLLVELPKLAFGFTAWSIGVGTALALAGLALRPTAAALLFWPVLLVLAASTQGQYSLITRLLLFTLPGWWWLAAISSQRVFAEQKIPSLARYGLLLGWLIVLGGSNVSRHYTSPLSFSDARWLVTTFDPGYRPLLHYSSEPAFDYYRRIHPVSGAPQSTTPTVQDLQDQPPTGKYVLLYDVLTNGNIRARMEHDQVLGAQRRCKVRTEAMANAARIYLDCP
ncbi:hypothetical protein QWY85_06135 [Neolewinella lacunae]|uniref:Glycosyltransferase RgtA/B/C/D-like domain-containing protein n=1 Tax=Neolewinella lacunae TaxID=1517758 RepID=A0A923T8G1_9BACT|nr:hypothetical protein [Neolewinella lacunae]MBC6994539.1 hypothetical protein [Neolewinella lacunae]MDN3634232.1 hypothetical protein [Neolewinella lacunae]